MVIRGAFVLAASVVSVAAQKAPPARDFGRALWANARAIPSSDNIVPAIYGLTAAGSASLLDDRVQQFFGGERVVPAIGSIGRILGNSVTLGAASGIVFYASYRGTNERFKAMSFDLTEVIVLDAAVTFSTKAVVRRERPDGSDRLSFHSGHASATTAAATVVSHYYPKAAIPAYLFAAFCGFSRLELNRHWLSDMVAGHAVGFILGRTVVRGRNPLQFGRLDWAPSAAPGGGFTINVRLRLGPRK